MVMSRIISCRVIQVISVLDLSESIKNKKIDNRIIKITNKTETSQTLEE